ncbi:MAG: AAC(3) family N-acetyltransferase [Armatimonadia bacterium]
MQKTLVTKQMVLDGLLELGLREGDVVFAHGSLSRFGFVEGGEETVIQALLEAVGPTGTLAMPGFTFQLNTEPEPVFDVLNTPCWVGRIYETFRTRYAAYRSHHCTHSVCAVGRRARELTATHSLTPCGATSPFPKLAHWHGKILFMGVSLNCNTTFHAVEEQENLFYMEFRDLPGATIVDEEGCQRPLPTRVHRPLRSYDFNRMDEPLTRERIQQQRLVGDAIARCVQAGPMFDYAVEAVRRDPEALLKQGEERIDIPVGRHLGG